METFTSAQQNLKGLKWAYSLFHPVQLMTHLGFHLTSPLKLRPVDPNAPATMDAMGHGLKLYEHEGLEGFSAGIASSRWANRVPVVGRLARRLTEMTFQDFLPSGKLALYENILARNRQRYSADPAGFRGYLTEWIRKVPGLKGLRPELTEDGMKTLSAVQTNFAMGGQPWRAMAMNPEFTHALQLSIRAPDFLASRLGFVVRAGTRLGAEERMALVIGTASMYTLSRIFNIALSDDHQPHLDDPFAVFVGNRKYSIRTVMGDVQRMVENPSRWWKNRIAPLPSSALEWFSGVNWMGRPVSRGQVLKDAALEAAPIPFTPRSDVKWYEQLMDATGLHVTRHETISEVHGMVRDWRRKAGLPEAAPMILPESQYLALREALSDDNTKAAHKAYDALRAKGKKDLDIRKALHPWGPISGAWLTERRFLNSLTPEQRAKVNKAKADKELIYRRLLNLRMRRPEPAPAAE